MTNCWHTLTAALSWVVVLWQKITATYKDDFLALPSFVSVQSTTVTDHSSSLCLHGGDYFSKLKISCLSRGNFVNISRKIACLDKSVVIQGYQ